MNHICRLCLSVTSTLKQKLIENDDFLWKISTCLQVKIQNNKLLPNQVCLSCVDKTDQLFIYQKRVQENQKLLLSHLELGEKYLENFYSSLYVEIKEEKEILEKHEEVTLEMTCDDNILENNEEIKSEKSDLNDNFDYSSDDNIKLSAIKKVKKRKKQKPSLNTAKKKVATITEAQENIHTAKDSSSLNKNIHEKSCPLENEPEISQENSNKEQIDELNNNFKCLTCFELFNSIESLRAHYYQKHQPPPKKIKDDELYIKDGSKFKCKKCEKSFPRICEMRRHALVKHAESRPYLCKICAKTFKDIPTILRHSRAHGAGERMACSYKCGYTTVYKSNLKDHETRLHRNDYKYKCETCGKGFIVKSWFEEHQNIHTGAKPFVCDICGIAYPLSKYLAHHRSMAHTNTSDVNRFNCLHCNHPCDSKNALKEHLSKEHGIKTSFLCNICGKTFYRYTVFKSHEAIHNGLKPHTCSICKKSFKTPNRLRNHEKIHSRAKNYVCLKCVKGYPTEIALNRHIARQHKV